MWRFPFLSFSFFPFFFFLASLVSTLLLIQCMRRGSLLHLITLNVTHSVGLLWTRDRSVHKRHTPGGIRARHPSKRAATDLHRWPLGHRDRRFPFPGILTLRLLISCMYMYIYIYTHTYTYIHTYIYMELLVKPEMLTSYIYGPTFGNAETVSFYLLHNVSTLNRCREVSCVTFVCKHFAS